MVFERVLVLGAERFDADTRVAIDAIAKTVRYHEGTGLPGESKDPADALFISLGVDVPRELLDRLPSLRYVGLFGTNLHPVDRDACRERGIAVTNVVGYCDTETAEFCLLQAISVVRGLGASGHRIGVPAHSLSGRTLGIVGVGSVGRELAHMARGLNMRVLYHSRSRKRELEDQGIVGRDLDAVLRQADVISLHVPPVVCVLGPEQFERLPTTTPIVNTCLGRPYDLDALRAWLDRGGRLVVDQIAGDLLGELREHVNVAVIGVAAYATRESIARRREIFCQQARRFLADANREERDRV